MKRRWNGKDSSPFKMRQEAFISQEGEVRTGREIRQRREYLTRSGKSTRKFLNPVSLSLPGESLWMRIWYLQ
jgi:hypothetical protein